MHTDSYSQTGRLCHCCCTLGTFRGTECCCVEMTELCCFFVFLHRPWCFPTSYMSLFLRKSSPRLASPFAFMEEHYLVSFLLYSCSTGNILQHVGVHSLCTHSINIYLHTYIHKNVHYVVAHGLL